MIQKRKKKPAAGAAAGYETCSNAEYTDEEIRLPGQQNLCAGKPALIL